MSLEPDYLNFFFQIFSSEVWLTSLAVVTVSKVETDEQSIQSINQPPKRSWGNPQASARGWRIAGNHMDASESDCIQ